MLKKSLSFALSVLCITAMAIHPVSAFAHDGNDRNDRWERRHDRFHDRARAKYERFDDKDRSHWQRARFLARQKAKHARFHAKHNDWDRRGNDWRQVNYRSYHNPRNYHSYNNDGWFGRFR